MKISTQEEKNNDTILILYSLEKDNLLNNSFYFIKLNKKRKKMKQNIYLMLKIQIEQ